MLTCIPNQASGEPAGAGGLLRKGKEGANSRKKSAAGRRPAPGESRIGEKLSNGNDLPTPPPPPPRTRSPRRPLWSHTGFPHPYSPLPRSRSQDKRQSALLVSQATRQPYRDPVSCQIPSGEPRRCKYGCVYHIACLACLMGVATPGSHPPVIVLAARRAVRVKDPSARKASAKRWDACNGGLTPGRSLFPGPARA